MAAAFCSGTPILPKWRESFSDFRPGVFIVSFAVTSLLQRACHVHLCLQCNFRVYLFPQNNYAMGFGRTVPTARPDLVFVS